MTTKKIFLTGTVLLLVVLWLGHGVMSELTYLTHVQTKASALVFDLN